jgi:hypothetical protein
MEWRIKHEARSGWGEVETIEVAHFKRRVVGDRPVPRPGKAGAELQRLVLQTQMEEYTFCARVCPACLKMRRQREGVGRSVVFVACGFAPRPLHAKGRGPSPQQFAHRARRPGVAPSFLYLRSSAVPRGEDVETALSIGVRLARRESRRGTQSSN